MSLYQLRSVTTLAVDKPVAVVAVCVGCVCVCEGCKLHVKAEQSSVFTLTHEVDVATCWRERDVCLVAAADRSGSVHVISPATLQNTMHSYVVEKCGQTRDQAVFVALEAVSEHTDTLCLLAMTTHGSLYRLVHNMSSGELKEMVQVNLATVYGCPTVCSVTDTSNYPHILMGGGVWPLTLWNFNESPSLLSPSLSVAAILSGVRVVQVQTTRDGKYIVTRTDKCEVQVWLVEVMVVLEVWGGRCSQPNVLQFSLYDHGGAQEHRLCMLCSVQEEFSLVVLRVPGMKQLFTTEVAAKSLLAVGRPGQVSGRTRCRYDYPLQGAVCVLQPPKSGNETRVTFLECSSPEERVNVLVSEGRLEEAEDLVKEHLLDPGLVLYAKATMLNQRVCAGEEGQLPAFLQCLSSMKDVESTATLLLESKYPSLAVTYAVLTALCAKLADSNSSAAQTVRSLLDRLTTFSLIPNHDCFREAWDTFQRSSCLQLVRQLLHTGRISHARLFWTRHQLAVQEELAGLDMSSLVLLIPTNLSMLLSWLPSTILPFILALKPHHMGQYLIELTSVLCCLEFSDRDQWPGNALALTEGLLASISELCPYHGCPPDVSPLAELKIELVKLASVLTMTQCPLSLETYRQCSAEQLVYRALDQAGDAVTVHQLITDKLSLFSQEHSLNLDTVLCAYLKLFLARAPVHSPDFPGSPWETKAVALTNAVSCNELRVTCCLELLHCASLSWGTAVANLVHDCLKLDTANAGELCSLYELLQMKAMLHERYGIVDFNFSDGNTGQFYMRYILLQRNSSVLADSLWVATKYNITEHKVYLHHLFNLCCHNQEEEAKDVMESLSPEVRTNTAQTTLCFCLHRLRLPYLSDKSEPASYCGAARLAVLCTNVLGSQADWSEEYNVEMLRRVRDLAVHFSVFLNLQQLTSPPYTSQLLMETLATISPSSVQHCIPHKTLEFGELLGYSEHEVYCQLTKLWMQQATGSSSALSLLERCPGHLILSLVHSILRGVDCLPLTPSLAHCLCRLAMLAATTSTPNQFETALHVFQVSTLFCTLLGLCVQEEQGGVWPWTARLSEQGLLLELAHLRPALIQALSALLHHSLPDPTPCSTLVDLLVSNGHLSLAYHTAVQCHLVLGRAPLSLAVLSTLLEKVLSMSRVDHSYGLALLLATPPDTALSLLHSRQASILSSYSRVISLCMLTSDYCRLVDMPQVKETASALMTGSLWGKFLRKYQVNFSIAFRGGNEEKRRVLPQLLRLKPLPLHVILAYCRTYGMDESGAMLTRLRVILMEWETGYQEAYEATVVTIRKHPFIPSLLETFLTSKVCPYDYERIQFVLDQVLLRARYQEMLSLLVAYHRCQPPSVEEEEWHTTHCHGVCMAYQDQRLPLHLLLEPQLGLKLLSREIQTTSAVARLAPMAHLIDVPEDQFYCTALTSLDTSHLGFTELEAVLECITHIPTRLTLTVQLANQLSSDVDIIAALEAALHLLRDPTCQEHEFDEISLSQQLCKAKVRQLLEDAGLGGYRRLVGDASIITVLYTELPLQQDRPAPSLVHQMAQGIADICSTDVLAITQRLIEEWLLPTTTSEQDLNTTLVKERMEVEITEEDVSSVDNWTRMVYLLTDNPQTKLLAAFLYRWATADMPILGPAPRLKALRLLLGTVPHSVLECVSGGTLADIREKVQHAVFVAELASVQVTLSMETFKTCNKQSLACNLLHSRADSPKVVRLAVNLCLHYRLLDRALWERLLDTLLTLDMMGFLQHVLLELVGLGAHHTVSKLSSVWQAVIQAPYEAGGGKDALAALHLLYQCPILFKLDLLSIIERMTRVGAHSHALATCLLLPPALKSSTLQSVLSGLPYNSLLSLLDEVTESSSTELSLVADVVYEYVDCSGQYECLLGTSHFSHLVQYLICHHRLSSLLSATLSRGRVTEAIQLVEMHHAHHSSSSMPQGMDGLKAYLEEEGTLNHWDNLIRDSS